jgi:pyridoxal phosphate enzyme (YggS family)
MPGPDVSGEAIADHLASVRRRIAAAAGRAARPSSDIQLIAVSKTFSAASVGIAAAAGQRDFGENRVQEAVDKMPAVAAPELVWHLIGHLQSNKAKRAAAAFAWIHSIDRIEVINKLDAGAAELGVRPRVLLQVDLAHEATKHGADEASVSDLVKAALETRALDLRGLMIVPPFPDNPEDSRPWFRRLRELRDTLVSQGCPAERLKELSMGMSHDFEIAIEEGATMVRVGTAIFGRRTAPAAAP